MRVVSIFIEITALGSENGQYFCKKTYTTGGQSNAALLLLRCQLNPLQHCFKKCGVKSKLNILRD
jgi:hypothetical protein